MEAALRDYSNSFSSLQAVRQSSLPSDYNAPSPIGEEEEEEERRRGRAPQSCLESHALCAAAAAADWMPAVTHAR